MKATEARAIANTVDKVGLTLKDINGLITQSSKEGNFSMSYIFYSNTSQDVVDKVIQKLTDDGYECVVKYDGIPKYWYEIKW